MGHSDLNPAIHDRRPWNAGQNVGPKRPLKPRDSWAIRFYLDEHRRLRDRALFDLANRQQIAWLRSGQNQDRRPNECRIIS